MREVLAITNALADESRVRALLALTSGSLCVCQIVELLQLAPSTVSKHLSILRQAGLVEGRKEGRWMYYALPKKPDSLVRKSLRWITDSSGKDPRIIEDASRLKAILKENPEDLSRRQMGKSQSCSSVPATPAGVKWQRASSVPMLATA
jgi:ArsR family transcriptional regulator, arsenate/arsenite/antimonite-responsive transcriptional repressor